MDQKERRLRHSRSMLEGTCQLLDNLIENARQAYDVLNSNGVQGDELDCLERYIAKQEQRLEEFEGFREKISADTYER